MTHEESQWLIRHKKRSQQDFGLILMGSALCVVAVIAYILY
jgi:hypothetical protein